MSSFATCFFAANWALAASLLINIHIVAIIHLRLGVVTPLMAAGGPFLNIFIASGMYGTLYIMPP